MEHNTVNRGMLVIRWNEGSKRVLTEFFEAFDGGVLERATTVLSEDKVNKEEVQEYVSQGVTFLTGNATDKALLDLIGAAKSYSVVIVADEEHPEVSDARTVLIVLALNTLFREKGIEADARPKICVEVMQLTSVESARDAGADAVVCQQQMALGLLAQCAFSSRVLAVYTDLLTYSKDGCEIYLLSSAATRHCRDIPDAIWDEHFEDKTFFEASDSLRRLANAKAPMALLGIARGENVLLLPKEGIRLAKGDDLVVLAWERPRL